MKINRIDAILDSKSQHQEISCIQLGNLYVCADKTNNMGHLVYDYAGWLEELRHNGFTISESEVYIEVDQATFNELNLKHYELTDCEIYLFSDLAVKVDDTLDVWSKKGITILDAVQEWNLEYDLEDLTPDMDLLIPKDEKGNLAVELEKLHFTIWDSFFRCPGETTEDEERFSSIASYYQDLSDGKGIRNLIQDALYDLKEVIAECKEKSNSLSEIGDYEYYIQQMKRCGNILHTARNLLNADYELDDAERLLLNIFADQCLDEEMEER